MAEERVTIGFGDPKAQKAFAEQYKVFISGLKVIQEACDTLIFNAEHKEIPDRIIFYLARLTFEDFSEIILLSGNGFSTGAMKILRGMFERTVVLKYLHKHPEEANLFLEFYWIGHYKLGQIIQKTFPGSLSKRAIATAETNYKRVKPFFEITDCKKCKTKRTNFTWTKKDLVTMAKEIGMEKGMITNYYHPMEETHSTVGSMLRRFMSSNNPESPTYDDGPKSNEDKKTLASAHTLLLRVLDCVKEHFNLDIMEKPIQQCFNHYQDCWKPETDKPDSTGEK